MNRQVDGWADLKIGMKSCIRIFWGEAAAVNTKVTECFPKSVEVHIGSDIFNVIKYELFFE